ncbi:hypothetical protein Tco_1508570 [Tanacetum coccineum]
MGVKVFKSLGTRQGWWLVDSYKGQQLDVKTTFLHWNLEELNYMRQLLGYVQDDMMIACKCKAEIGSTKSFLKKQFDIKELKEAKKILGMEIIRDQSHKILRESQFSPLLDSFMVMLIAMPKGTFTMQEWKTLTSTISDQTKANLKAQLIGNEVVRVKIPKCMSWLDSYDVPIGDLDMMEDKVDNSSPQSTPQVLPSFEVIIDERSPEALRTFKQMIHG